MPEGSGTPAKPGKEEPALAACPSCGTPNPATMNFCKMCGDVLRPSATATPAAGTPAIPPAPEAPSTSTSPPPAPVVAPVPSANRRAALPSALAAVVGSPVRTRQSPATTLRKPMIAAPAPAATAEAAAGSSVPDAPPSKESKEESKDTRVCTSCGAATPTRFSFCQQCGVKLEGAEVVKATASTAPVDAVADTLSGQSEIVPLVKKRGATAPFATLVSVLRDGTDGTVYPLAEDATDLGRTDGTITFDDRFLAPRHARIERRAGGAIVLAPLDSTNGVYVRLRAGESYPLVDGDYVLLGKEVLRFEVVEPEERALGPAIQHGVRLFGSPVRSPWGRLRQIVQTGASRDIYHLVPAQVVIGREEGDLRFADDEFMSRRHARLTNHDGRYEIADLESSNGSYVRVRGERVLRAGDHVRMGDQLFRFEPLS